jgi:hypothetical protein
LQERFLVVSISTVVAAVVDATVVSVGADAIGSTVGPVDALEATTVIAGLSPALVQTLGRPVGVRVAASVVGADTTTVSTTISVAVATVSTVAGLSLPLAKTLGRPVTERNISSVRH